MGNQDRKHIAEIGIRDEFMGNDKNTTSNAFQRMTDVFQALSYIQRKDRHLPEQEFILVPPGWSGL